MNRLLSMILLVSTVLASLAVSAETEAGNASLAERSLALRTALHQDPTLETPLDRLLQMYREKGREQELLQLYQSHLQQYPGDVKARIVLIRLLVYISDDGALPMARTAAEQFSDEPYIHFLHYRLALSRDESEALAALDKAASLARMVARKQDWVERLVPLAIQHEKRSLARTHLLALADHLATAEAGLSLARLMSKHGFDSEALDVLKKAAELSPPPETMVEIELAAAKALTGLGKTDEAATALDGLLGRVTADYWRREEILRRRIALAVTPEQREVLLKRARTQVAETPDDESAVLDLAQLLIAAEYRREALDVLMAAAKRLPESARIEEAVLSLFDRLRDERGREQFLRDRLALYPDRDDLVLARIKSLFVLGRVTEGRAELEKLTEGQADEAAFTQRLALARHLRTAGLLTQAESLFSDLVEERPDRLDVRREVAEIYLARGNRSKVRQLFAQNIPDEVPLDILFDALQFMTQQKMFMEARRVVRKRLESEKTDLRLRMLLLDIERRLGNVRACTTLMQQARALADTPARYRMWLDGVVRFCDEAGLLSDFVAEERKRLDTERGQEWSKSAVERRMVFVDVLANAGLRSDVVDMLEADLKGDLPPEVRLAVRRRLVASLGQGQADTGKLREHLTALSAEAGANADEVNARLVMLHARENRADLMWDLLEQINVDHITDAALLKGLLPYFRNHGRWEKSLRVLERLTVLDPSDHSAWEQWIRALAVTGDEERLRVALRRLRAGVGGMALKDETRVLLRGHLMDSYWRSIARLIKDGEDHDLKEALVNTDGAERVAVTHPETLWITWARAYLLNALGRVTARDEAIEELVRVSREVPLSGDGESADAVDPSSLEVDIGGARIVFPDGLSVDLSSAKMILTRAYGKHDRDEIKPARGPLPPLKVRWAFDTDTGHIFDVLPLQGGRVLVCDSGGNAACVDRETGKLHWEKAATVSQRQATFSPRHMFRSRGRFYHHGYSQSYPSTDANGPVEVGRDQVCLPTPSGVVCLQTATGELLWQMDHVVPVVDNGQGVQFASGPLVRAGTDQVYVFSPHTGIVSCLAADTGKIVWETPLDTDEGGAFLDSGLSLDGDHLLVYGRNTAVFDAQSGQILWTVETGKVREFPVQLTGVGQSLSSGSVLFRGAPYHSSASMPFLDYTQQNNGYAYADANQRFVLSSPVVQWARQGGVRRGVLNGGRLLLMGHNTMQVLQLELPLPAQSYSFNGTYLGIAGDRACFLQQQGLSLVDLEDGSSRQVVLQEFFPAGPENGCIDGLRVYISGDAGVACVNARTSDVLFTAPWPDVVLPVEEMPSDSMVVNNLHTQHSRNYLPGGRVQQQDGSGKSQYYQTVCAVREGVLYALQSPDRLVALGVQEQ